MLALTIPFIKKLKHTRLCGFTESVTAHPGGEGGRGGGNSQNNLPHSQLAQYHNAICFGGFFT